MKFLIGGAPGKIFHLKEFGEELKKHGMQYLIVNDSDYAPGISKKGISEFFRPRKKFNELIKKVMPDVVLVDRRTNFGIYVAKAKIPLLVHLRGDIWSEAKWVKENLSLKQEIGDIYRRNIIWEQNFKNAPSSFQAFYFTGPQAYTLSAMRMLKDVR